MVVLQRRVYCTALLLWVLSIVLFPTRIDGEISWLLNAARLSLGVLVLGAVVRAWNWWTGPKILDPVIAMAWSLSLWQVIAWPCLVFSGAWMVSDLLAAGILSAGLFVGVVYGVWSLRVHAASTSSPPATNVPVPCEPACVSEQLNDQGRSPISALAWFALGFIGALCLIFVILWAASFFRGPILGYNELGGVRYARDQFFVQLGAGLAVLTIGWSTALGLRRLKAPRPLTWGIIVCTTPLGLAFACGM
jgi:hypothetical protein